MSWIKTDDQLPKDDQWCWIYVSDRFVDRGCFDAVFSRWVVDEGALYESKIISDWQPYFTPAPPDAYDTSKVKAEDE